MRTSRTLLGAIGLIALNTIRKAYGSLSHARLLCAVPGLGTLLVLAADVVQAEVPENATRNTYGSGWACDSGYRRSGNACLPVVVPKDAYTTSGRYGRGWECRHGFRESNESCAYLSESASAKRGWKCERGYMASGDSCAKIAVPENAYLSEPSRFGSGWECDRGFVKSEERCVKVTVPENAHLGYDGASWECNKPFHKRNGTCAER